MLEYQPQEKQLDLLLGGCLHKLWTQLCDRIDEFYEMDKTWNDGGKAWD